MALLYIDGFDHYNDADSLAIWPVQFNPGQTHFGLAGGRHGGYCLVDYGAGDASYIGTPTIPITGDTIIVGCAMYHNSALFAGDNKVISVMDGATVQCCATVDEAGYVRVYRGDKTAELAVSASAVISTLAWYYIELKVKLNDTTGTVEVRVDGTSVCSASGVDTTPGTTTADRVRLWNKSRYTWLDDFYWCDGSGTSNNDFLGAVRVDYFVPTADGTNSDFTTSTGTDHYALIDEAPNDTTTDYVEGTALNQIDSYVITPGTPGYSVKGVMISAKALNPDAGAVGLSPYVKQSATESVGSETALSTTAKAVFSCWDVDPNDSSAWTDAKLASAEFGVKVTTFP